jgi:hypothetical protein
MIVPKNNPSYVYIATYIGTLNLRYTGTFYKSTDYGKTFTSKLRNQVFPYTNGGTNTRQWSNLVCSEDGKYVYASTSDGNQYMLYKSNDYAELLVPICTRMYTGNDVAAIACDRTGRYFSFVSNTARVIAWSSDYGSTFTYKTLPSYSAFSDPQRMSIDEYKNTIYIYSYPTILYSTISGGISTITDISNVSFTALNTSVTYEAWMFEVNRGVVLTTSRDGRFFALNAPFDLSSGTQITGRSGYSSTFQPRAQFMIVSGGNYSKNNGTSWTDLSGQAPFNIPSSNQNIITENWGSSASQILYMNSTIEDASLNLYMLHTNGNLYTQTITLTLT